MMYPYMTLPDNTEVTHSQMQDDGSVKVYIETPYEGGFKDLICILPEYKWINHGYSEEELTHWKAYVHNNAHIIMDLAAKGGFRNARGANPCAFGRGNTSI